MLKITPIPAFQDNYIWLIIDDKTRETLVVDPGDAAPVLHALKEQNLSLSAILITHKHQDHTGGVSELLQHFSVPVFGNKVEQLRCIDHDVEDQDIIHFKHWPEIKVFSVPGHTLGHVMYYIQGHLFCGDTLFGAGCGRLFEGTPEQMYTSLNKIKALHEETLIYCAHEYTLKNLSFAKALEPNNKDILERIKFTETLRQQSKPSIPSTLALEKKTNPFLRCDQPKIQANISEYAQRELKKETEVFRYMREWRDQW